MDSRRRPGWPSELRYGTPYNRFRVKLVELCGGKAGAGGRDCRGGGGCGVVLLAMVHGRVGKDTLLTGSNFWSELKIEYHGIKTILFVLSCSLLARRTGGFRFILLGRSNLTGTREGGVKSTYFPICKVIRYY